MSFNKRITLLFPLSLILYELPLYFSNTLFLPALPEITKSFHVTNPTAQLNISFWFLGASIFQVILGPLSDHYSRRKILLSGGLLFIVVTLVCSFTHSIIWFFLGRFFQGYAASTILITGYAEIHEIMNSEEAVKITSLMGSITILAAALGPLLGSLLLSWMNWRNLFIVLTIFAILSLNLLFVFMPKNRTSLKKLNLKKVMMDYQFILSNVQFWIYSLAFCFLFAALIAWNTLSPFYLMSYLNMNRIQFGWTQAVVYAFFILGINLKGLLKLQIEEIINKRRLFLTVVSFILSAGNLLFLPQHFYWVMGSILLFYLSTGFIFYSLNRKAIEIPKEAPMATTIAVFTMSKNLFGFLGSLMARSIHF